MLEYLRGFPISDDTSPGPYRVQSAYDALRLLELIVGSEKAMNASEIAAVTGAQRNRVFRLLRTLEESGYVIQDARTRAYRPSLKVVSLGHVVGRKLDLDTVARPIMESLRNRTSETVYLVALEGLEAVSLITLESGQVSRISAQPGRRWLVGNGAAGLALLLALPDETRSRYLDAHPELLARYESASEHFQRDGVTFVDGRYDLIDDEGVMAVAVPVYDRAHDLMLTLAVAWPTTRPSVDYDTFRLVLLETAATLERALGGAAEAFDFADQSALTAGDPV